MSQFGFVTKSLKSFFSHLHFRHTFRDSNYLGESHLSQKCFVLRRPFRIRFWLVFDLKRGVTLRWVMQSGHKAEAEYLETFNPKLWPKDIPQIPGLGLWRSAGHTAHQTDKDAQGRIQIINILDDGF